ncbi:carbon-nitrogen hydrolase family protein [Bacillus daqingensis]|uniref:Carbon-nitrogen hydrolase family protein n=1 Tax=Bacillus daqingensis TaxID=872396 RepID=A0ABV9NVH1_9BACI
MKIAIYQPEIPDTIVTADARNQHVKRLAQAIRLHAAKEPFDMIVLPELATITYSREAFLALDELAEPADGTSAAVFKQTAKDIEATIVFGLPIKEDGLFFIAQVVIDHTGHVAAVYRKRHLAQFGASMERDFFSRGTDICTFDCKGVRIGLMICYDIRFPEHARRLAWEEGADVLLHPSAFSKDDTYPSWHAFVLTRAVENQVYLLSVNRAGAMWGGSVMQPPWSGWNVQADVFAEAEAIRVYEIDAGVLEDVRRTYSYREDADW